MISEEIKNKIKSLYLKQKYDELIDFTEEFTLKEHRPSGLINLLAISYYSKKNSTKDEIFKALNLFEESYLKEKDSIHGLNAIKNLIIVGIKTSKVSKEFSKFLIKAKSFYLEAEINFAKNHEFLQSGILLFSYLLDKQKLKEIINIILEENIQSKDLRGQATFMSNYFYDFSQEKIKSIAKKNSEYFSKLKVKNIEKNIYNVDDIINLGFVSCDLVKNHSVTYFLKNTLKNLDKSKFRIFLFSLNKKDEKDLSQNEFRNIASEWFDMQDLTNQQIIEIIQKKNIKILFDLIGYTNSKRIEIFNSRVAPIQISWLAYCNTTGFNTVDYILADKNLIYENENNLYSEKVVKLPNIWNAHSGFTYQRKFNELPFLEKNNFTFGSLNNFMKISTETLDAWCKILDEVDNSNLILKSSNFHNSDILRNKFKSKGLDDKVIILDKYNFKNHKDHINIYKNIDLCLDTFPWNGVTTTFESLWMNVPVLVLKGNNFNSRCGESIIKNSNNNFLIAKDFDEYISKAIFLAKDKEKLKSIRKNLYDNVLSTDIFDTQKFTKNFTEILLTINKNYNSNNL